MRPATALLAAVLTAGLATTGLGACSGGSASPTRPSASQPAGVVCPTARQITGFVTTAFGDQAANPRFGDSACEGGWAAGTVTLKGGLEGRIALRWSDATWTPVLVGGAAGPCPATVRTAPASVLTVLGC